MPKGVDLRLNNVKGRALSQCRLKDSMSFANCFDYPVGLFYETGGLEIMKRTCCKIGQILLTDCIICPVK